MLVNTAKVASLGFLLLWVSTVPCKAGFPVNVGGGSGWMESETRRTNVSLNGPLGTTQSNQAQMRLGYLSMEQVSYRAFLATDHPLQVHAEPAGAGHARLIPSSNRHLRVAWSDGSSGLPVQYRVYLGSRPDDMLLIKTTADRFFEFSGLTYLQDFYWEIEAVDAYGRATMSPAYSFSIAPAVEKFFCAPNPFRAGSESTTCLFNMPGDGSAKISIYAMPSFDRVYSKTLGNLSAGINNFSYQGQDDRGRSLFNGVYMAVIEISGGTQHATQKFKLLVVK